MNNPGKIAIGMSGGLDSSVAAALLCEQGYEVIGLTAHMWKDGSRCCSLEDVQRARKICWHLDIKHYVLNGSQQFSQNVVDPFVDGYARGTTPSPCILCNEKVKFGYLLNRAVQFGCQHLATGHYASIAMQDGSYKLTKATDPSKDQTYFLHRLSQEKLAYIQFPLGQLSKSNDVRPYAEKHQLPISDRGESQDLCFVAKNEYASFVEARCPAVRQPGAILDSAGKRIGTHQGMHKYTIGQRRGIGVAATHPLFVISIDANNNTITVGPRAEALGQHCRLRDIHWISGAPPDCSQPYQVRLRYLHQAATAKISCADQGFVDIEFRTPQFAISPGQAGVIYNGNEVLGGGWIVKRS